MSSEQIAYILVSVVLGPMLALVTLPLYVVIKKIFMVPFMRPKLLQQAIAKGNVVTATLESTRQHYETMPRDTSGRVYGTNAYHAVYVYQYHGKTYRYHARSTMQFPQTITLYFLKHPSKACQQDALGIREEIPLSFDFFVLVGVWVLISYFAIMPAFFG